MVLQQFGGVNAIAFYASAIFISAGMNENLFQFFSFITKEKRKRDLIFGLLQGFLGVLGA